MHARRAVEAGASWVDEDEKWIEETLNNFHREQMDGILRTLYSAPDEHEEVRRQLWMRFLDKHDEIIETRYGSWDRRMEGGTA